MVERSRGFWYEPGFYATLGALVLLLVAGRSILADGLPAAGLALPLPDTAWATLRSYGGGWNTSGLGSPAPLHPSIGATAVVQLILLSNSKLAEVLLTVGAVSSVGATSLDEAISLAIVSGSGEEESSLYFSS